MEQQEQYSTKRLFVGKLPTGVPNYNDLIKEFAEIGEIVSAGQFPQKGYMFIEYAEDNLANKAVMTFKMKKYHDKYLNVSHAKLSDRDKRKQLNVNTSKALERYRQLGGFNNQNSWGAQTSATAGLQQQSSGQNMEYGGNSGQNWEGQQLENFSNYNDDWYNNTSGGQQTGQSVVGNNLWPQGGGDLNSWGQGIGSTSSQGVAIPPPLPLNEHLPRDLSSNNPTNRDVRNLSHDPWTKSFNKRERSEEERHKSPERSKNKKNSQLNKNFAASNLIEANDVEIVCFKEKYTKYAEWIEERLTTKGLKVDVLYPNPEITLEPLLCNISVRKGTFAIVINADSKENRTFDVYVLQGEIQEHKNMPETDAFSYMVRNYSKISSRHTGKVEKAERPTFELNQDVYKIFKDLHNGREVEIAEYDKAIQHLVSNRDALLKEEYGSKVPAHLLVPPCAPYKDPTLRGKQEEVQEYVLEILNKNPDILMQTKELPNFKAPQQTSTRYSNETNSSINHAPSSTPSNMNNMNNFNMADMGKLFGMMQSMLQQNQSGFNS